jgi:hypothetical protein
MPEVLAWWPMPEVLAWWPMPEVLAWWPMPVDNFIHNENCAV